MPKAKKPRRQPSQVSLDVNLVPKDPFFQTAFGRSLRWALSIGRYIVIFTELVVIVSFVTRFTLDRQVTDLNASINQKRMVIESYGDLEQRFLFIQQQMADYQELKQEANLVEVFPLLNDTIPSNVVLDSLLIKADEVVFTGSALSSTALNVLVNNVQLSPYFSEVNIGSIESRGENLPGVNFDLTASINTARQEMGDVDSE